MGCELLGLQAWVLNATIQENITLDSEVVDQRRYDRAVYSCALEPDLEMLPHGSETEVGERGVTISGECRHCTQLSRYP